MTENPQLPPQSPVEPAPQETIEQKLERALACKGTIEEALKRFNCYVDVSITISTSGSPKGSWKVQAR